MIYYTWAFKRQVAFALLSLTLGHLFDHIPEQNSARAHFLWSQSCFWQQLFCPTAGSSRLLSKDKMNYSGVQASLLSSSQISYGMKPKQQVKNKKIIGVTLNLLRIDSAVAYKWMVILSDHCLCACHWQMFFN